MAVELPLFSTSVEFRVQNSKVRKIKQEFSEVVLPLLLLYFYISKPVSLAEGVSNLRKHLLETEALPSHISKGVLDLKYYI